MSTSATRANETAGAAAPAPAPSSGPQVGKSGKKICCSCPDTRRLRDECMVMRGESECAEFIEAHKACLREEGFRV